MPKYNYKADALTDFFKGKLSAKELDKIARNDFGSGVATKKELSNFLSNKFTQDVMSDTYGIPAGTLVKRVRDLMKFAESVNEVGKPTISKPFKSNDRTFDKVYDTFDKKDYFNSKGLAKVQIGNFERALKKNDKGAQQVLDMFKGDEKKAKDYITQVISDRNKERAFNNYKALKSAVDSIQKGKPNVGAVDYVKRIIHNSSQKYSIALYSTLRNKKFTKWKDVHDDIDSLIGESVNENAYKTWLKKNDLDDNRDNKSLYHHLLKKYKSVSKFPKHYNESVNEDKFYNTRVQYTDPKSKKKFVGDVVRKDGDEYKVNLGKDGRFEKYILAKSKDLKIVSKSKKRTYESVNEAMKPSQVSKAISRMKKLLMKKWQKRGGYENFGQRELDVMKDKLNYNPYGTPDERKIAKMLDGLDNWAMNYDGNMREAYVVLYSPKKGVKPVTTAAYKDKKDAEKWAKDLGGITMIVKKKVKGIDESLYESKTKESKVIQKFYQYSKTEKKFYDELAKHEVRIGQRDYAKFIINALKGFGINPREFKRIPDAEEKLYQTVSSKNEDLRNWFKSKWVNIGKKDKSGKHPPCGTSGKKRGYAKCVPAAKAATMSKKEKESATRRKRAAQNKSNRGGKSSAGQGKKPINVSTHTGGRKSGTGKGS